MARLLSQPRAFRRSRLFAIVAAALPIGAVLLVAVLAAGSFGLLEPENATLAGGATSVTVSGASGGKALKFNAPAATPTPTPTPTGGVSSCALPKYPTQSCTGVPSGTVLANLALNVDNDSYAVTTPGAVIDSKHIPGHLLIRADNVIIKNSQIDGNVNNDYNGVMHTYTILDSTIGVASNCITAPGLSEGNYTATRVKVLGHDDGFRVSTPGNVTVTDSYAKMCWNPPELAPPDGSHSGGLQATCADGTCYNTVFNHNTIDNSQENANSGITMQSCSTTNSGCAGLNPISGLTANDNLLMGGGYTIIFWWTMGPNYEVHNNRVVNNSWDFAAVDAKNSCSHQNWSGNSLVTIDAAYNITSTVGSLPCMD